VPIDVEWILERTSEALGKPFGVLIAFGPDLENHEFIAAEPRDHVAGPDDSLEPRGNFLEQLVTDRMAERVVDRLESVEIDQMDRDVVLALMHRGEHAVDALAELVPVGEARKVVVFGKMRDALLRTLAFGYVLENDDRAAARHHPA